MNAKKAKQLRKIARALIRRVDPDYDKKENGTIELAKMTQRGILKELKKSFK